MSGRQVLLAPDVVVEPLVARWYAWTHLVSPGTSGMNAAFRQVRLMESFLEAPQLHVEAARNPALRGGPFLDLPPAAAPAVAALLEETRALQAAQIAFGHALRDAMRLLAQHADGHSLEPLYALLPEPLRGRCELVYTPGGAADLRLIEPLLYRSALHDPALQTAMLSRGAGDARPFALSTPRPRRDDALELARPFHDPAWDLLGRLRTEPKPLAAVLEGLGLAGRDADLFTHWLQDAPPPAEPAPPPPRARWRYFGHACVLVELPDGQTVLVDPLVAGGPAAPDRHTLADLPRHIDYVLLTHNHQDHVLLETLLALRWKIGTILVPRGGGSLADPSLKLALQSMGFANVLEMDCLDSASHGSLRITALPFLGEHADLDIRSKTAWLVEAGGASALFAADSNNLDPRLYDLLRPLVAQVDLLFLGMECAGAPLSWLYGPLLPQAPERGRDQSRRLNGSDFRRGMALVQSLGCSEVFVYAMGREPWLGFISSIAADEGTEPMRNAAALVAACEDQGIPASILYGRAEGPL